MVNNRFYQRIVFKTPTVIFLIVHALLITCSYDRGINTDSNGIEMKGYVRFNECYDRYVEKENKPFTEFKDSEFSGWKKIDNKSISSIRKGDDVFVFTDLNKIPGESGADLKIPLRMILSGSYNLYSYCSARYMSTMISSKRLDLNVYLISGNNGESFMVIPHSPDEFRNFSSEHFSSCPGLVKEIQNRKFTKKIENPIPGNTAEYESVDEKDIIEFAEKYNLCLKNHTEK